MDAELFRPVSVSRATPACGERFKHLSRRAWTKKLTRQPVNVKETRPSVGTYLLVIKTIEQKLMSLLCEVDEEIPPARRRS